MYYKLNENKEPVKIEMMEWAMGMSNIENRIVKHDKVDGILVSTVFLGMDHRFGFEGPPVLFETMIFGGEHDQYQERYCTYQEAEAGHKRALEMVLLSTP
jgi:hypothetical protein